MDIATFGRLVAVHTLVTGTGQPHSQLERGNICYLDGVLDLFAEC